MSDVKSLRKKYLVSFPIQGSILARCAGYWVVYQLFFWHVMFGIAVINYQSNLAFGGQPQTFLQLYGNFARQNYMLLLCSVMVLPVLAWDITHFTHRIAGPLVRLRNDLERLHQGKSVEPIQLRKDDLMQEVIDAFNAFVKQRNASEKGTNQPGHQSPEQDIALETETLGELRQLQSEVAAGVAETHDSHKDQILVTTESKWA